MRGLLVISLQNIIYSSFLMVEMNSQHDRLYAKVLLFMVFLYLAFFTANISGYNTKRAFKMTIGSLTAFLLLQQAFWWVYSSI
ncbi:hypothetical protein ACOI1C_02295 [Bacillus sp. DJP31]|uniref:hypothetical protein n=1 Tax=Bacillus sp. DJP31 TaxID=3409789 RepID=UPI003BB663BB